MHVLPACSRLRRAELLEYVKKYQVPLPKRNGHTMSAECCNVDGIRGPRYEYDRQLQEKTARLLEAGQEHKWMCGQCQVSKINHKMECLVCHTRRVPEQFAWPMDWPSSSVPERAQEAEKYRR